MPDSPYCRECRDKDIKDPQTYKIAGKPAFKCSKCGKVFPRSYFNQIELDGYNR